MECVERTAEDLSAGSVSAGIQSPPAKKKGNAWDRRGGNVSAGPRYTLQRDADPRGTNWEKRRGLLGTNPPVPNKDTSDSKLLTRAKTGTLEETFAKKGVSSCERFTRGDQPLRHSGIEKKETDKEDDLSPMVREQREYTGKGEDRKGPSGVS